MLLFFIGENMIKIYNKEFTNQLKNVEINKKTVHFHNIKKDELIFMYKKFYQTNNLDIISSQDMEIDNISFSCYENWLVGFDD